MRSIYLAETPERKAARAASQKRMNVAPEVKARRREQVREYRSNRTPEQIEKERAYQREYKRRIRAAQKEATE